MADLAVWEYKDSLRQMTDKFNAVVIALNELQKVVNDTVENIVSTEEVGSELTTTGLYDPQISAPVKQYIESRLIELFAGYTTGTWQPNYNIATNTQLGVVKSGDVVTVNPSTGMLDIPELPSILSRLNKLETELATLKTTG